MPQEAREVTGTWSEAFWVAVVLGIAMLAFSMAG